MNTTKEPAPLIVRAYHKGEFIDENGKLEKVSLEVFVTSLILYRKGIRTQRIYVTRSELPLIVKATLDNEYGADTVKTFFIEDTLISLKLGRVRVCSIEQISSNTKIDTAQELWDTAQETHKRWGGVNSPNDINLLRFQELTLKETGIEMRHLRSPYEEHFVRSAYFGGRTETISDNFVYRGKVFCLDVNQLYPFVASNNKVPYGKCTPMFGSETSEDASFVRWRGVTHGGIPHQGEFEPRYDCTKTPQEFYTQVDELLFAAQNKLVRIDKILNVIYYPEESWVDFKSFYKNYSKDRADWDMLNMPERSQADKLAANMLIGKFAANKEGHKDRVATHAWELPDGWTNPQTIYQDPEDLREPLFKVLQRSQPSNEKARLASQVNVSTAATITAHARIYLLKAILEIINSGHRVFYYDTDSIFCSGYPDTFAIDPDKFGAWKVEAEGDLLAIYAKKHYLVAREGKIVKKANISEGESKAREKGGLPDLINYAVSNEPLTTADKRAAHQTTGSRVGILQTLQPSYKNLIAQSEMYKINHSPCGIDPQR